MRDLSVYIHWPFCLFKCHFCDFNSVKGSGTEAFLGTYFRHLDGYASWLTDRRVISIYFGGGTPSLLPPAWLKRLVDAVAERWPVSENVEISMEADPASYDADTFSGFRSAGVNRLSLGVQAFDEARLTFLSRLHNLSQTLDVSHKAAALFPRLSMDLIYGTPGHTVAGWTRELETAASVGAEHLSLYALTIEPGTPFARQVQKGFWTPPDADQMLALEGCLQGFQRYEVSSHARFPKAQSRHNRSYWELTDCMAVGPGAHGRLHTEEGMVVFEGVKNLADWEASSGPERRVLTLEQTQEEVLFMGLRLVEGIPWWRWKERTGRGCPWTFEGLEEWLTCDSEGIRLTHNGFQVMNAVVDQIVCSKKLAL